MTAYREPRSKKQLRKIDKKLRAGIRRAAVILDSVAAGHPFALDAGRIQLKLKAFIDRAVDSAMLSEEAGAYYTEQPPGQPAGRRRRALEHKRKPAGQIAFAAAPRRPVIGYHMVPERLILDQAQIKEALGLPLRAGAVRVLGAGLRESEQQSFGQSGLLIAPPGGVDTARYLLRYLYERHRGREGPPLIIENSGHYWDPVLQIVGLADERGRLLPGVEAMRKAGVYVTRIREETVATARTLLPALKPAADEAPYFPPGSLLCLASRTFSKFSEFHIAAIEQRLDIKVVPIDMLVDFSIAAEENQLSFQGNAAIKAAAGREAWDRMPPGLQAEALKRLGKRRDQVFIGAEDSGIWAKSPRLQDEEEFAGIRHVVPAGARFPGVETGPSIWGGGGIPDFADKVLTVLKRRNPLEPHLDFSSLSTLALLPLQPDARGERPLVQVFVVRDTTMVPEMPEPGNSKRDLDLGDFMRPRGGTLTVRQMPSWIATDGPRAGIIQGLGLAGQARRLAQDEAPQPLIASDTFRAAIYARRRLTPGMDRAFINAARSVTDHTGGVVSHVRAEEYPVLHNLDIVQRRMFAKHDAVVLHFDTPSNPDEYARRFVRYGYVFFSALVAQQTADKYMMGKQLAVLDMEPGGDKIIDRLTAMVYDLHQLGAVPQEPRTLFKRFDDVKSLAAAMQKAKAETFRYPPFSYSGGPMVMQETGTPSTKDYHAVQWLTANLVGKVIVDTARDFTQGLCDADIGVVSGGGTNKSGMGVVTGTVHKLALEGKPVHHTGITVPHICEFESKGRSGETAITHRLLTKNIYGRLYGLVMPDMGALLPGGTGSLQEWFARMSVMMTQKGPVTGAMLKHGQTLVFNMPISAGRGFYDVVLQHTPQRVMDAGRVHVVSSVDAGMQHVLEHRAAMRRDGAKTSFDLSVVRALG